MHPRTHCYLDSLRPTLFVSSSLASITYYRSFELLVLARPRVLLLSYSFLSFSFSPSLASVFPLSYRPYPFTLSGLLLSAFPLRLLQISPSYYTLLTSIYPRTGSASYTRLSRSHRLFSTQQGGSKRSRPSAPSIILLSCCIRQVWHLCVRVEWIGESGGGWRWHDCKMREAYLILQPDRRPVREVNHGKDESLMVASNVSPVLTAPHVLSSVYDPSSPTSPIRPPTSPNRNFDLNLNPNLNLHLRARSSRPRTLLSR